MGGHIGVKLDAYIFFGLGGPIFEKREKGEEANISHKVLRRWDSNLLCGATAHKEE